MVSVVSGVFPRQAGTTARSTLGARTGAASDSPPTRADPFLGRPVRAATAAPSPVTTQLPHAHGGSLADAVDVPMTAVSNNPRQRLAAHLSNVMRRRSRITSSTPRSGSRRSANRSFAISRD